MMRNPRPSMSGIVPYILNMTHPSIATLPASDALGFLMLRCFSRIDRKRAPRRPGVPGEVSSSLQLLEVGANLGDCSLWAAAHLGRRGCDTNERTNDRKTGGLGGLECSEKPFSPGPFSF